MASTQDSQEDDTFVNETPFSQLNNDADPGNMEQSRKRKQDTNVEETQNKAQKVGKERAKCWSHFDVIYIDEEDGVKRKYGRCKYCKHNIKADPQRNGTQGLNKHVCSCSMNPESVDKKKQNNLVFKKEANGEVSKNGGQNAYDIMKKPLSKEELEKKVGKMVTEVEDRLHGLFMIYKERLDNVNCNSASQEARNEEAVEGDDDNEFLVEFLNVEESNSVATGTELKRYLLEPRVTYNKRFDILMWWKQNAIRFPIVSRMAKDILAIQISTVASESAFSTSGRVLDPYRTRLSSNIVEALVCTQDWVRKSRKPIVDDVADILNDDDIAIEIKDAINKQKEKGKGIRS
ncbi:hypothetical protein QVD17_07013 [Tagetes erecta]|uniref:BED-type domain-containing protein n=1 Tax=Tagetes erecta TaxID=13708 RepID=A0AAD8LKJ1_TARER|nr:hypothetical protein QVD17_07013 [Tagetes erecta]